jgi:hypothetical protein
MLLDIVDASGTDILQGLKQWHHQMGVTIEWNNDVDSTGRMDCDSHVSNSNVRSASRRNRRFPTPRTFESAALLQPVSPKSWGR